mmetsp:Transcript_7499/g.28178  ORF Transcript_7499/g.28178 Transcript_7499/m.28178 type:complete len:236 (-) Transcript_7499:859-1566(-)
MENMVLVVDVSFVLCELVSPLGSPGAKLSKGKTHRTDADSTSASASATFVDSFVATAISNGATRATPPRVNSKSRACAMERALSTALAISTVSFFFLLPISETREVVDGIFGTDASVSEVLGVSEGDFLELCLFAFSRVASTTFGTAAERCSSLASCSTDKNALRVKRNTTQPPDTTSTFWGCCTAPTSVVCTTPVSVVPPTPKNNRASLSSASKCTTSPAPKFTARGFAPCTPG